MAPLKIEIGKGDAHWQLPLLVPNPPRRQTSKGLSGESQRKGSALPFSSSFDQRLHHVLRAGGGACNGPKGQKLLRN